MFIVALDPGHGGPDPGAVGNDITEAEYVFDFAEMLGARINTYQWMVRAELTRKRDEDPTLSMRATKAENSNLFLCLHIDSNPAIRGLRTYYLQNDAKSLEFCKNVIATYPRHLKDFRSAPIETEPQGWKSRAHNVLKHNESVPVKALIEMFVLTDVIDSELAKKQSIKEQICLSLMLSIATLL